MFALLAALSLGAVVPQDTVPEPVVIDLRVGRISVTTVQAYRVRSEVLLPLSQFFQLVEIRHRLTPDGRLEATVDPGNFRIVIDPRSDSMQYGDRRVRIEREFIRFESPELYVGSARLGDLFGVMFAVDWSDLTATVIDPSSLPIARRLRREAAREAYLRRPDGMRADLTLGLQRPSWDGVVVDYSLYSPSSDPLAGSTYGFGLGADVGGGSLEMLAQSVGPAEQGRLHVDASWTGVWRENRWVKQLRLGDVASTGPRSRALEGVSITNAPFVRPSICRCTMAKTRSTSSPMARSARSANSTAPIGCCKSCSPRAGSSTGSRQDAARNRPLSAMRRRISTCATAPRR